MVEEYGTSFTTSFNKIPISFSIKQLSNLNRFTHESFKRYGLKLDDVSQHCLN